MFAALSPPPKVRPSVAVTPTPVAISPLQSPLPKARPQCTGRSPMVACKAAQHPLRPSSPRRNGGGQMEALRPVSAPRSASRNMRSATPPRSQSRRRMLLSATPLLMMAGPSSAASPSGDWSSPGLNAPESRPKFMSTSSGVKFEIIESGKGGTTAKVGSDVLFDYVLRRSNGYFIYGTIEGVSFQPKDVPVGPVAFKLGSGELIQGLEEVLIGMKPGAKIRCLVPSSVGYSSKSGTQPQPPTFATRRQLENHSGEALLFEVQLLRVDGVKA